MKIIIQFFGLLIIIAGISLLVKPEIIFGWIEDNMESRSFYFSAIVFRSILGILLIAAAKKSKFPRVIKFFGYLAVIAALTFIFMGHENFLNFIVSIISKFKPYAAVSGSIGVALGGFLIYAFATRKVLEPKSK